MSRLSTRQWRDDDLIIATGKSNPYRPGSGAYERAEHVLDAARRGLTFAQYRREYVDKGLTRATTLRTLVREGVIRPLIDPPPAPAAAVATDAAHAVWLAIRELGEQISRLADENLRRVL